MSGRGRPRAYTAKKFEAAVEAYFRSISRYIDVVEMVPTGDKDQYGHVVMEAVRIINQNGEKIKKLEYAVPPTVGGLCAFLKIDYSTFEAYLQSSDEEYSRTAARARGRMRAYLEEELLTRKNVDGIKFNLANNFGYTEKKQVELGEGTQKLMERATMTMDEKEAILREIAEEFGKGDGT